MNIAIKQPTPSNGQALIGKVSLVTGSTSGIGLGIARALAAAGSRIVLNGFGKADEIARVQAELAAKFNVDVSYSGADMFKPESIQEMIEQTLDTTGRVDVLVNNTGIQHVAPLQDFPPQKVGRDHRHQSVVRFPHDAARTSLDAPEQVGAHYQYR